VFRVNPFPLEMVDHEMVFKLNSATTESSIFAGITKDGFMSYDSYSGVIPYYGGNLYDAVFFTDGFFHFFILSAGNTIVKIETGV